MSFWPFTVTSLRCRLRLSFHSGSKTKITWTAADPQWASDRSKESTFDVIKSLRFGGLIAIVIKPSLNWSICLLTRCFSYLLLFTIHPKTSGLKWQWSFCLLTNLQLRQSWDWGELKVASFCSLQNKLVQFSGWELDHKMAPSLPPFLLHVSGG